MAHVNALGNLSCATGEAAKVRNAQIRSQLRHAWPQVRWTVRNGELAGCAVVWADGPSRAQVADLLETLRCPLGRRWKITLHRTLGAEFTAVALLRVVRAGTHRSPAAANLTDVDALTFTDAERVEARLVLRTARVDPEVWALWSPADARRRNMRDQIADAAQEMAGALDAASL